MSPESLCPRCGARLPAGAAPALCPACLLRAGLAAAAESSGDEPTMTSPAGAPRDTPVRLPVGGAFGPYRIVRLLGAGGMGEVYEAEHVEHGRRVALKVLNHALDSPRDRDRFLREGRLAASINHPNSVYIFGTDDVDGTPAIAMELAPGGTLKDAVEARHALTIAEAVDAILQVIDGLEAAAAVGVLHRDVKPSNCFVDGDGVVKIGDFGLSISTLGGGETMLTAGGTIVGTPAFASPEQLRGDVLDVRSDIYSVGATLYYLLTGRAPFAADNLVHLIAHVAATAPTSPAALRPDVPRDLAGIVLRCLAKEPAKRFPTYAALRTSLTPIASGARSPASPSLRAMSVALDNMLLSAVFRFAYVTADIAMPIGAEPFVSAAFFGAWVLYTAVGESVWGATAGKWLLGLRVVGAHGRLPFPRALGRTLVYGVPFVAGLSLLGLADPALERLMDRWPAVVANRGWTAWTLAKFEAISFAWIAVAVAWELAQYGVVSAAVFATARRRNGFAGVHDLVAGARVVSVSAERRPSAAVRAAAPPLSAGTIDVGPYIWSRSTPPRVGEVAAAFDPVLRRRVWIHVLAPGAPSVDIPRRQLARPGRLRWLNGRRTLAEAWDAYEGPDGETVAAQCRSPQPWSAVRFWLRDIAEELRSTLAEGTTPPIALDRLWVTPAGRVRLLEWRAPDGDAASDENPAEPVADATGVQDVLARIAAHALGDGGRVPVPLAARVFLDDLRRHAFADSAAVVASLDRLCQSAATISHARRAGHLAIGTLVPAAVLMLLVVGTGLDRRTAETRYPDAVDLANCLTYLERLDHPSATAFDVEERHALEQYIVGRFKARLAEAATREGFAPALSTENRRVLDRLLRTNAEPTHDEFAAATAHLQPFLADAMNTHELRRPASLRADMQRYGPGLLVMFSAVAMLSATVMRGGVLAPMLGMALVTSRGERASRLRSAWRAVAAWSPVVVLFLAETVPVVGEMIRRHPWVSSAEETTAILLLAGGGAYALLSPQRGLQDHIAGTWLVPK